MHIQIPAKVLAGAGEGVYMIGNEELVGGGGSAGSTFLEMFFTTVMIGHIRSTTIKNMQFSDTLFSIIL